MMTTHNDWTERILRVTHHIRRHLDCDIALDDLATIAHFSPFHFHRVFRGMVGESVMQHVRRLRLERAAGRLKLGDSSISTLAKEAGYDATESFSRAFHRMFGCSPSAFRARFDVGSVRIERNSDDDDFAIQTMEDSDVNIESRTLQPMRIAAIHHVGPYQDVGRVWERLAEWVGRRFAFGPDTQLFGASYDDPEVTDPRHLRYDACVTVDDGIEPEGEVEVRTFPGGRYAVALHEGPYDRLSDTYAILFGRWCRENDREPGEPPALEFYLNDPNDTPPDDLLTEVWVPLIDLKAHQP